VAAANVAARRCAAVGVVAVLECTSAAAAAMVPAFCKACTLCCALLTRLHGVDVIIA
jgi:hypothetical protein